MKATQNKTSCNVNLRDKPNEIHWHDTLKHKQTNNINTGNKPRKPILYFFNKKSMANSEGYMLNEMQDRMLRKTFSETVKCNQHIDSKTKSMHILHSYTHIHT